LSLNFMLDPLCRGINRAERKLREISVVGESEFERRPCWFWRIAGIVAILVWAAIRYWT